jgi:superfamily II DNA or RNA helicase
MSAAINEWVDRMRAPVITPLRGYQNAVTTKFYENDALFAILPMGAGKTAAAMVAFADLHRDGHRRHALIVAPKLVATATWPAEITTWAPGLRFAVLDGGPDSGARSLPRHASARLP